MMTTTYWTLSDLAHHCSLSYDTVQKWPHRGYGPKPYIVVRGRRLYRPADVYAWHRSRLQVVA